MFTGIVEELGTVAAVDGRGGGARLRLEARQVTEGATEGCSIAVNGVCLTAVSPTRESFAADLAPETLRRSNLGDLKPGHRVNLERPLAANGRLDGHIVQGHVDATGEFLGLDTAGGEHWWLRIGVPDEIERLLVYKGSIAIDGISLTVASIEGRVLSVTIIPHTYRLTNLHTRRPGDRVNLECDILAKYVDKLLRRVERPAGLSLEKLAELGY